MEPRINEFIEDELDKRFIDKEELKKKLRKWARECHKEAKESKSTENRTDLLILKHALREIVKKIDTLGGEDGKR